METHYPTINEPASPEYVLAVFQDMHRQACQYDPEGARPLDLSMENSIAEWRGVHEMLEWRELGRAWNEMWGINCTDEEWRAVLEPARRKRIGDVCRLIAGRTTRPRIRPLRVLNNECVEAGAFLTVRSLLLEAGASEDEVVPSAPIAPIARKHLEVFLGAISRLAPRSLPDVQLWTPHYDSALRTFSFGLLILLLGGCCRVDALIVIGCFASVLGYAMTWFSARCLLPTSVRFGEVVTFRDLARVLARGTSSQTSHLS